MNQATAPARSQRHHLQPIPSHSLRLTGGGRVGPHAEAQGSSQAAQRAQQGVLVRNRLGPHCRQEGDRARGSPQGPWGWQLDACCPVGRLPKGLACLGAAKPSQALRVRVPVQSSLVMWAHELWAAVTWLAVWGV